MSVIDFPNSPTNGDELQAPNKFVYRWTNGNRWKNIHRPLIIPDYVWPDLSNPDDPFGTGDPGDGGTPDPGDVGGPDLNGGGGDDWLLEVIDFPVNNGEGTIRVNYVMNQDPSLTPTPADGVAIARIADFRTGSSTRTGVYINDPACEAPDVAQGGMGYGFNAVAQALPDLSPPFNANPGTAWYSVVQTSAPDYNEGALRSWMDLDKVLSEDTKADRTQARFRIKASGSFIGGNFTVGTSGISAVQYNVFEATTNPPFKTGVDFGEIVGDNFTLLTKTSEWIPFNAGARYLCVEGIVNGGFEIGDIVVEIDDPNAPADRTNLPVGFASNPELTFSAVAFDGTSGPVLRTMKHADPARLTSTSYWQTESGLTGGYLDVSTGNLKYQRWTCLWFREDLAWYATVDSATPNTVESRHLYTVGDISTHSEIILGRYDFKDYASKTPNLGYAVANIHIDPTGTYLYTMDSDGDIYRYTMSTAWDLGTVDAGVYDKLELGSWGATCFTISADGYVIVLLKAGKARQVIMETPWDLLTSVESGFERDFLLENPIDICISYDTGSIFVLDIPTDTSIGYRIYNYTRNI